MKRAITAKSPEWTIRGFKRSPVPSEGGKVASWIGRLRQPYSACRIYPRALSTPPGEGLAGQLIACDSAFKCALLRDQARHELAHPTIAFRREGQRRLRGGHRLHVASQPA